KSAKFTAVGLERTERADPVSVSNSAERRREMGLGHDGHECAPIGNRARRLDDDVELERLKPRRANLHVMRAWRQLQPLKVPVEVVDDSGEVPINPHLG